MAQNMPFRVTKPGSGTIPRGEARDRLKKAVQAYKEGEGSLSISKAARLHVLTKITLYNGRRDQASYGVTKQRLTSEEEESIENWVLEIQSWGFSPRVAQLREMAEELLQARGDYKELGINCTPGFLTRHPILQSKYSRTLDQKQFLAQDPAIIQEWFDLYQSIKDKYGKLDEDMDENGYMMGIAGASKVMFSKYQKQAFIKQAGIGSKHF